MNGIITQKTPAGHRRYRSINRRTVSLILGGALWIVALGMVAGSIHTVRARVARPMRLLLLDLSPVGELRVPATRRGGLLPGDRVFLTTEAGLQRIGEVRETTEEDRIALAIEPAAFDRLNASTRATCWRTPLSAEETLPALLPRTIQQKVAERIATDWREHEDRIIEAWTPLAQELASAYLDAIGDDLEASFRRHQEELWSITRAQARAIAAEWPIIEESLGPILEEHLTPVLGRLMHQAASDAPKMAVAWSIARGRYALALQHMLDGLADYLAAMSEEDKAELAEAARLTWEAARDDPVLAEHFSRIGHNILDDRELRGVLTDIYREAVAENPRTTEFLRRKVFESPRVRKQMYTLIEAFAPTARGVLALCLFDEAGGTRAEIVHLIRWASLGRNVAWVTLKTHDPNQPALQPGTVLAADFKGTRS